MITVLCQNNDGTPTPITFQDGEHTVHDALRAAYISLKESDRVSMDGIDVSPNTILDRDGAVIHVTHKNTSGR